MIQTIYLDLDGVLCDLVTSALTIVNRRDLLEPDAWPKGTYDFEKVLNMPAADLWKQIHEYGPDFWEHLPTYWWCAELILAAQAAADEVYLLTTPTHDPVSTLGKHRWLRRHFGKQFTNYIFTPAKHHLAGPGRVLIDDYERNTDDWTRHGGTAIVFPQPWNHATGTPSDIIDRLSDLTATH